MKNSSLIKSSEIKKIFNTKTLANGQSLAGMSNPETDKKDGESPWKDAGYFVLKTAAISGVVLGGTALALPAIGFTSVGVAGGSLAAGYQSAFLGGTIASGSTFAMLQSIGAAGLAASTQALVVASSAVVAGSHSIMKKLKKRSDSADPQEKSKESDAEEDVDEEEMGKSMPAEIVEKWKDVELDEDLCLTQKLKKKGNLK